MRRPIDLQMLPMDVVRAPQREMDHAGAHRGVGQAIDEDETAEIVVLCIGCEGQGAVGGEGGDADAVQRKRLRRAPLRSEEHTSELQSLMRISYAVFCLKKKKNTNRITM